MTDTDSGQAMPAGRQARMTMIAFEAKFMLKFSGYANYKQSLKLAKTIIGNLGMPIIKSAKKKMRKDKRITAHNKNIKDNLKALIKGMRKESNPKNMQAVQSALDKAAKTKLIHPNKASRLKSRLSKTLSA